MRLVTFLSRSYWLHVLRRCSREVGLVVLESIGVTAWSQYRQYQFTAFASVPYLLLGGVLAGYLGWRIHHARAGRVAATGTASAPPDGKAAPAGTGSAREQEILYSLKWAVGVYGGLLPFALVAWCGWATPLVVGMSAGALLTLRRVDAERRGPRTT